MNNKRTEEEFLCEMLSTVSYFVHQLCHPLHILITANVV